jgi:hypothetical protein
MSDGLTALASENLNPSLRSLLEDVQKGHIRVPRFQRPFIWSDLQRVELLRSIRDNMPIGSLLVWRTVKFKLASFPNVGPHQIPAIIENAPAIGWQYLLDGHQRVSTLLGLLLLPNDQNLFTKHNNEESIDWDIQYDLSHQDFIFKRKTEKSKVKRPLLPLSTLLDGRLVNKHMRDLRKRGEHEGWTDEQMDTWEERADQLSYRFQQCRIPIVVMVSDDLELAARTFQRINSLGTPMGESHLVAALTWRDDFDLRDEIDRLRQTFPIGWRNVDENLILQVCKGLAKLDITKSGQIELVKILKSDTALLNRAGAALKDVLEWLSDHVGVVREELLPYALQAVILATERNRLGNRNLPIADFSSWFWRTSWSEVFSTAAYRDVRSEQEAIEDLVDRGQKVKWQRDQGIPDRFDFRSARVRLFTLRLAMRDGLCNAEGQVISGHRLLKEHGRNALVRLLPIPKNASPELKRLIQGPGNRFLIEPSSEKVFRERLLYGPDFSVNALTSHFIDSDSLQALRDNDFEQFLERRQNAIELWDEAEWTISKNFDAKRIHK